MMLEQVVVVEYQPAFLPCVRTLEDDLKVNLGTHLLTFQDLVTSLVAHLLINAACGFW